MRRPVVTGRGPRRSLALLLPLLSLPPVAGCSATPSTVRPPTVAESGPTAPHPTATPSASAGVVAADGADPAVAALHAYLREQARAVDAGTADPAALPAFTATLTPAARSWALPLLAENLGDRMPGPYPVGVLGVAHPADDVVVLALCLQDRGWQTSAVDGRTLNPEHFATASATVRRTGDRWLVDDVAADGGTCASGDVVRERFP